ncbi:MAG: histone deacetylase family protein [Anaerolineae bacterium]|jgi:acetoin utilization deacetylase AcuC-like enzyme
MHVVYTAHHKLHATADVQVEGRPFDTEELPARAEIILAAARSAGLGPVIEPTDHGLEPVLALHDPDYVTFLQTAYTDSAAHFGEAGPVFTWTFAPRYAQRKPHGLLGLKGYYAFGWGSPILEGTWPAAYWSVQCALTAADRVRSGELASYALCRPPGHHAAADLYGGFCYLNNAAIAARYLQGAGERIAILDVDYHHGNGTQLLFYDDPTVLYCSLHVHPDHDYPYYWGEADELGEGPGHGYNRNWPLPRGTDDVQYLTTLDEALAAIDRFAPGYLVLSAGLDTIAGDPAGGFELTIDGLAQVSTRIAALGLPAVIVQEGGYLLERLGESAVAFLQPWATLSDAGEPRRGEDLGRR